MADDFYLSRDAVREIDRRATDEFGLPSVVLMENAGRGCAELMARLNPDRQPVTVLCGPGNNGGDGFVIARHLDNRGWPVRVWVFAPGPFDELPECGYVGDAAVNYHVALRLKVPVKYCPIRGGTECAVLPPDLLSAGWVVDALFGTGLSRGVEPPMDAAIARVNASGAPVLAVDLPSGLDCDTGAPLGATVRAAHTATFVARKLGFRNPAAKAYTGEVHVIDIGAPRVLVDEYRNRAQ